MNEARRQTLAAVYDQSARSLFLAGDPSFAEAVAARQRFGPGSRFTRTAYKFSRVFGLPLARKVLGLAGWR
jgi:hypothetical protein